jgi:hypothetical protein
MENAKMKTMMNTDLIRYGSFGPLVQTQDGWRMATQEDLDILPAGEDLTPEEEAAIGD